MGTCGAVAVTRGVAKVLSTLLTSLPLLISLEFPFFRSSQGHGVHLSSLIVLHFDAKPFWERFHSLVVEMHPFRGEGGAACFLVSTSISDSIRRTSSKPIMCPSNVSMYLGDLSSQSKQLQQWMLLYSQRPCLLV